VKVALNARLLSAPTMRGWSRYILNLLSELPALGVEPYLYSDRPLHPEQVARLPPGCEIRVSPSLRYPVWEQWWLPNQCRRDAVDLLHTPIHYGVPWAGPCPAVMTLHDAIEQVYDRPRQTRRQRLGRAVLIGRFYQWVARRRATWFIANSEYTKTDLVNHLGLPANRITVTHLAADPGFHCEPSDESRREVREALGLDRPFFLYVGGWEDRKNVPFLLRAFAQAAMPDTDLVLAGGEPAELESMRDAASRAGIAQSVRLLPVVEEGVLTALYAQALAFVYPSRHEGFGFQLVEAMTMGCPVLAARATCLPEILGRGGETFGLSDSSELALLLPRLHDDGFRRGLVDRARARAVDFSWARTAAATVEVYRQVVRMTACPGS